MAFGNVKPLMKENVEGAPPSKGMLKKKVFGKVQPLTAPPSVKQPSGLFKRLTGK